MKNVSPMRKIKLLSLLLFFFQSFSLVAQMATKTEPLILGVEYLFIHKYDKEDTTKRVESKMILLVSDKRSVFNHETYTSTEPYPDFVLNAPPPTAEQREAAMKRMAENANKVRKVTLEVNSKFLVNEQYSFIPSENKMVMMSNLNINFDYKVELQNPEIDWEINNEVREIGGIRCQKATGFFKGRSYTGWFATSLPFPFGPWKLKGLPGLILEAADSTGDVQFLFKELLKSKEAEVLHYDGLNPVVTSEDKYLSIKEKYFEDPIGQAKRKLEANEVISGYRFYKYTGETVKGEAALNAIKEEIKTKITNPLELKK